MILGCIAISQIDREPEKYKSNVKCHATAGITLYQLVSTLLHVCGTSLGRAVHEAI